MKFALLFLIFLRGPDLSATQNDTLYSVPNKKNDLIFKENKLYKVCDSVQEYKKALEFLIQKSELELSETQSMQKALAISKGCDGAAERFSSTFTLLKKSGVDIGKSFDLALEFSQLNEDQTKNFQEIFKKSFLENHLNLDFLSAYRLSLELSKDYVGDLEILKRDFLSFVNFCTSEKEMALSFKVCTDLLIKVTRFTSLYSEGVFPSFKKLYTFIKEHRNLGLSTQDTLNLLGEILAHGPKAPENFQNSINDSLAKGLFKLSENQALSLALALVKQSLKESSSKELSETIKR